MLTTGMAALRTAALSGLLALAAMAPATAQDTIRMALGDIESVETLNLMIALERTRERGVDVELLSFGSEDLASQAVINGDADIGIGTPYAAIQNLSAPIRIFFQLSTLRFFPVVDASAYQSWEDLDGEEFVVHSRTSGTLALANLMAQKAGIEFSAISYVPGSEVRGLALLNGTIKATFLDSVNANFVMREAPDKFLILEMPEATASDEALYANSNYLEANADAVQVLCEELLTTWRMINENPQWVLAERERLALLADLPGDLEPEIEPYFVEGVAAGMFPNDGGRASAARTDLEFYAVAGQVQGDPAELAIDDFWDFRPLDAALAATGG